MGLTDSIHNYAEEHLAESHDWYSWKINTEKLPIGVTLAAETHFERSAELKVELSKVWANADSIRRRELVNYYVQDFGGIRANSNEKMAEYATLNAEEIIAKGKDGVASWSKVLCMHDPETYAIYDARVAVSLNALSILKGLDLLFPLVPSRNRAIATVIPLIRQKGKTDNLSFVDDHYFYKLYLSSIRDVAQRLQKPLCTIEMLLFGKAEELASEVGSHLLTRH